MTTHHGPGAAKTASRGILRRLVASAAPRLFPAQSASAEDAALGDGPTAALPTPSELAEAFQARERRTFPCRFESRCVQTALGHGDAASRWTERLWIGERLRVLRILPEGSGGNAAATEPDPDGETLPVGYRSGAGTSRKSSRGGVEAVEAFDGSRLVVATRNLPHGRWHGSVRRDQRWVAPSRALASFFLLGSESLAASISGGAVTIHGFTDVDQVRCVLVEVTLGEDRRSVLAVDPAREFLPRAVWIPAPDRDERPGDGPRATVGIPCTQADGASATLVFTVARAFRAAEVETLPTGGAPYPSRICSEHDAPGGVHLDATVLPQPGGEDEAIAGTEGAGLAALMPEGGTLFDADIRERITFGVDGAA